MAVVHATPSGPLRRAFKRAICGVALLVVSPLIAAAWLEACLWGGELLFTLCAQALAIVPGFLGDRLRGAYYFGALERCSWETHFGFGTVFTHRNAVVGARVSTGLYCVFGHVQIGDDVMIGSRVSIPSGKRQHLDDDGQLTTDVRFDCVLVGSRCWIGEGAILLAPVGDHCLVSAGAVVTKDMPPDALIGGNPARILRSLARDVSSAVVD